MQPVLDELAETHADRVIVRKVHVDKNPVLVKKYKVMMLGTSIFLRPNGEEYSRKSGFLSKEQILEILDQMKGSEVE